MPRPVWAKRGFDHDGAEAWRMLCGEVLGPAENTPLSIYLHVPFCDRRCGYCDCHSISMPRRDRQREADYCRILLEEIDAWAGQGSWENRPVTTVHFGGGTPNYLSRDLFSGIVSGLRRRFGMTAGTEWALETTGSLLTGEHLSELKDLGIGRLHVGVQTLEEGLRRKCGRRQSVPEALRTLTQVLEMGFITSVDVIYGLPGQTLPVFLDSLQRLVDVGVHGFSLYRLNVSARNRRFVQRHGKGTRDHLSDYLLLQGGELLLRSSGYGKTHFTHYALAEDRNLYFTHPMRGEDLLAIGASADGFFGPYHYRHPDYEGYVSAGCGARGVLEGGLFESEREQSLRPAVASLMAGSIREGLLREMGEERLLDGWLECALLERQGDPGSFSLTANGSWFIDDMLDDLMKASSSQS
jgi:coproporphyrinogen III oxidase-like Fe-S oxidoreductase